MPLPVAAADDPLSWRVVLALAARLERVRVANGYLTDLGADVRVDGGQIDLHDIAEPVTWIAGNDFAPQEGGTPRLIKDRLEIAAAVFLPGDSADQMRLAHRARFDLRRAFFDTSVDMPKGGDGGSLSITVADVFIEPRPNGANCIQVQINAQAGLAERLTAQ
jgi:hypothetical protein